MGIDGSENAAFFAELFGCNERTIQRLAKDGKVPKQGRGRYPVYETVAGYIQHISEGKTDSGGQLNAERTRLTKANATKAEIELAETQGELISVDEVRRVWEGEAARIRSKLLVIPTKTAPRLKGKTKITEIQAVIKEEIYEALQELSAEDDEPSSKRKKP